MNQRRGHGAGAKTSSSFHDAWRPTVRSPSRTELRGTPHPVAALLFLGLAATTWLSCVMPRVDAGVMETKRPVWTVDLREHGYTVNEFAPPALYGSTRQLAFGTNEELVVAAGDLPTSAPAGVQAFVLDARTGTVASKVDWRTKSRPYVFATTKGEYATNTETGLALYVSGLKRVIAESEHSTKMASPDGRSLAAWESVAGRGVTLFLDSGTLRPTGVEFIGKNVDSISRDRIAYIGWVNRSKNASVLVEDSKGNVARYETACNEVQPHFVSESMLAVVGCDQVEVINAGGPRLFLHATSGDSSFAGASRDGSRFSIVEASYGWGHDPGLRSERFTVFDVRSRTAVFSTNIKELRGRKLGRSGAALSPDGSFLAINSLGVVRLFNLPSRGPEGH